MKQWFEFYAPNNVALMHIFLPGAKAVFSTRHGGVSTAPFDTMNLGFHVWDKLEAVSENRKIFAAAAEIPLDQVICANQVHGTNIQTVYAGDRGKGVLSQDDALPETDGMITIEKNVALAAFFADCVPIYLVDSVKGAVGLVHAGRKGTVNGIAGKAVAMMADKFGSKPSDCYGFIGPSIGSCCYAVGEEIVSMFTSGRWKSISPVEKVQDKWMLDLWKANKEDLLASGMSAEHIGIAEICTYCDRRFFSYRRDGGRTGRMGAFISVKDGSGSIGSD
jgi:YfiH family protein